MDKLGIDLVQILAQLLNFGIIFLVLKKFLYRPILKILQERKAKIDEGIALQQKMQVELEKLAEKEKKLEQEARAEASKLAKQVQAEAEATAARLIQETKKRIEQMRQQAREEAKQKLKAEKIRLEKVAFAQAAELANQALVKLLDEKTRLKLTASQIEKVTKV